MKVVFLVINYMPHQMTAIETLIKGYGAQVHAFHHIEDASLPCGVEGLYTYRASDYTSAQLAGLIASLNPQMVVVAGWAVGRFVSAAKLVRKELGIPVVTYSDTVWRGTLRQRINALIAPWHVRRAFTHAWVAGVCQFEYARRLGFAKERIIFNALSCKPERFLPAIAVRKNDAYPKNILFVGRFVPEKGLDMLCDAWEAIEGKRGWTLTLAGVQNPPSGWSRIEGLVIKGFVSQDDLPAEMATAGAFVLSSRFEQWGMVLHEAASAGLPLVATTICGATPHFLINGYNGFTAAPSAESIRCALENIIATPVDRLAEMGLRSRELALEITPEKGAAQLMGILKGCKR